MEKDKQLKEILKTSICGFIRESELNEQEKQFINKMFSSGKIGIMLYHSHIYHEDTDSVSFDGIKIGYYYRTKNIFSWKHKKVCYHF